MKTPQQQRDEASKAYLEILDPAQKAYEAITTPAYGAYEAIKNSAYEAYKTITTPAYEVYRAKLKEINERCVKIIEVDGKMYKLIED